MNFRLLKISILFSFTLAVLAGCQQEITYQYLMTHPWVLKSKLSDCEQSPELPQCEMVVRAGNDFDTLVNDQQNDPEAFGQTVLRVEYELSLLSAQYEKAKLTGDQEKIVAAKKTYQEQLDKLQIYQAVLALRSPN